MNFRRIEILCAVEHHHQPFIEGLKLRQRARRFQPPHRVHEDRLEARGIDLIENGAMWLSVGILAIPNKV